MKEIFALTVALFFHPKRTIRSPWLMTYSVEKAKTVYCAAGTFEMLFALTGKHISFSEPSAVLLWLAATLLFCVLIWFILKFTLFVSIRVLALLVRSFGGNWPGLAAGERVLLVPLVSNMLLSIAVGVGCDIIELLGFPGVKMIRFVGVVALVLWFCFILALADYERFRSTIRHAILIGTLIVLFNLLLILLGLF